MMRRLVFAFVLMAAVTARAQSGMGGGMGGMGGMGGAPPPSGKAQEDILPEVDAAVGADAQKTLDRAEKAFANHDWLEAIAHYRHVMQKFAYNVPLASQAELRLGDVAFERGRWSESRGYYRNFLRFHPRHEKADYAAFRIGLCAFKDIPGGIFLEPPSEERDQAEAKAALRQLADFLERYPKSAHVQEAREIITKCEDRLASHELYVAKFYAKRGKWKGVALRTEGLVKTYPNSSLAPEALELAVQAHSKLGEAKEATKALETLEALTPNGPFVAKARAHLAPPAAP